MNSGNIDAAIDTVCQQLVWSRPCAKLWIQFTEEELYREVLCSILGSRVPYEIALAAAETLIDNGLLHYAGDHSAYQRRVTEILKRPLVNDDWPRARRFRFPIVGGRAIARTAAAFYQNGGSLKAWLCTVHNSSEARHGLVKLAMGLGPKQASLVLRNIGFSDDVAILDSHVLRFMMIKGLMPQNISSVASLRSYETVESAFLSYASGIGWPAKILDQGIWIVMRVFVRESR